MSRKPTKKSRSVKKKASAAKGASTGKASGLSTWKAQFGGLTKSSGGAKSNPTMVYGMNWS